MKTTALVDVLTAHGNCTHKDGKIVIAEETAVSLYASLGNETLILSELASVTIQDDLVLAVTRKGDTFAVVSEDLRALRVGKDKATRRTGLIGR